MALYGGVQSQGKRMIAAEFTPTSITTTINTEMRTVDSVIIGFVSTPSSAHSINHYTASTNGAVRITHMTVDAYATATSGWSRLSYIIVGDDQPPASSGGL